MGEVCSIESYPQKHLNFKQDVNGILRELDIAPILEPDIENITQRLSQIRSEIQNILQESKISKELIDIILSNTVIVVHRDTFGKLSYGTGAVFQVEGKQVIVSAGHVVNGMNNGTIKAFNGGVVGVFRLSDSTSIPAKTTYLDKKADLGFILPGLSATSGLFQVPDIMPEKTSKVILVAFKGKIKNGITAHVSIQSPELGYWERFGIWMKDFVGENPIATNIVYLPHISTPGNSGAVVLNEHGEAICHISGSFLNVVDNCELSTRISRMYINYKTLKLEQNCN